MNRNKDYSLFILVFGLVGCQPEKEVIHKTEFVYLEVEQEATCAYSGCEVIEPKVIEPEPVEPPQEPTEETEPDIPMIPIEPVTPPLPEFILNGLIQIDESEYLVTQGGNISMSYESGFEFMQDFELPSFMIDYRYRVMLDIIITNDVDELCIRSDFKVFGMAKSKCLYSDVRESVPLLDIRAAFSGYRVVETKVSMTGVSGLSVIAVSPIRM